jgi:ABC-type transport system involved in cytochrome c biogenesis permease component
MTLLPIVERELRVAARRPGTHWMRFSAALAVIAVGFCILLTARAGTPSYQVATGLFAWVAVLAFGFCLFAGVWLTADCLSVEKREDTLGLLFLTDLKGYDVVLGKLAATSVQSVYALTATFPMLALPLLMGGVTGSEFGRIILVLVITLGLSLALGMLASAVARDSRQTLFLALGAVAVLASAAPCLAWTAQVFLGRRGVVGPWWLCSPAAALALAFDVNYRGPRGPAMYWDGLLILLGIALVGLATASALLPRTWQQPAPTSSAGRFRQWWQRSRWREPGPDRVESQDRNPFYWLVTRDHLPRLLAWAALGPLGLLWGIGFFGSFGGSGNRGRDEAFALCLAIALVMHVAFKVVVTMEATRRLSEDRQSGALELLLVTPLPPAWIVGGQQRALWRHFRLPLAAVGLVNLLMLWYLVGPNPIQMPSEPQRVFGFCLVGGLVVLGLDFHALGWVGMLMGLRSRRHSRAVWATLSRVLLPPWLTIVLFLMSTMFGNGPSTRTLETLVVVWFLFGALLSALEGSWAKTYLLTQFRERAAGTGGVTTTGQGTKAPATELVETSAVPPTTA